MKQLTQLLAELVAVDSQSSKDNSPIINLISGWLDGYEKTEQSWVREDGVKGKNMIVKIPGKTAESSLVFVCHMDTVPTSSAWETDPFIVEEIEGKLYGLGTCDTKGGVAALLEAVFSLQEKPAKDTYLVFDGDEESSTTGARKVAKSFSFSNPQFIFIEPTDQQLVISQKSLLKFEIKTTGTSIHASQATPENNEKHNAIYKLTKILHELNNDAKAAHPHATQNIGVMNGGTAANVFADTATVTIDRRLAAQLDPKEEFNRLKEIILNIDPHAQVRLDDNLPAFNTSEKSSFVTNIFHIMREYIPATKLGIFPAWSEAGLFNNYQDVVVMGPGSLINQAHRANEFVEAKELFHFVEIFKKILQNG